MHVKMHLCRDYRLFRSALRCQVHRRKLQLQADIPSSAPAVEGFNVVMNRVANIVLNVTEKKPSNVLHAYPENSLLSYIGEVNVQ